MIFGHNHNTVEIWQELHHPGISGQTAARQILKPPVVEFGYAAMRQRHIYTSVEGRRCRNPLAGLERLNAFSVVLK